MIAVDVPLQDFRDATYGDLRVDDRYLSPVSGWNTVLAVRDGEDGRLVITTKASRLAEPLTYAAEPGEPLRGEGLVRRPVKFDNQLIRSEEPMQDNDKAVTDEEPQGEQDEYPALVEGERERVREAAQHVKLTLPGRIAIAVAQALELDGEGMPSDFQRHLADEVLSFPDTSPWPRVGVITLEQALGLETAIRHGQRPITALCESVGVAVLNLDRAREKTPARGPVDEVAATANKLNQLAEQVRSGEQTVTAEDLERFAKLLVGAAQELRRGVAPLAQVMTMLGPVRGWV